MPSGVDRQVSTIGLLQEAALEIYNKRAALLTAVLLPILISTAIQMACWQYVCVPDEQSTKSGTIILMSIARVPFYVMFATICHRVVLLGAASLPNKWGLFWSFRETRFLGWLFVLALIAFLLSIPVYYLAALVQMTAPDWTPGWYTTTIAMYLGLLLTAYIDGRIGLVLPATAVGDRLNLTRSWRITAENGWSIFFALVIPALLIQLIEFVLFRLVLNLSSVVGAVASDLLLYPLIAVGVVVLTIAYRDLVVVPGDATPEGQ